MDVGEGEKDNPLVKKREKEERNSIFSSFHGGVFMVKRLKA